MHKALIVLIFAAASLAGCNKLSAPAKSGDAVQQKLQELAGGGASDCGRLKSQAPEQIKPAGDCAIQAAQGKHPFYVAYDLPGMTVAVAGNSEGKFFLVQSEHAENQPPTAESVKSGPCPSEVRIAQSGRVTCSAPGSMGGLGGASPHGGMSMPPGGGMAAPTPMPDSSHAKPGAKKQ
jgi:hypothetical protein